MLMILFVPGATRKKHKIITQALVIIKLVIKTKQNKKILSAVSRMGVVSAMNGVYYECGFEVSITARGTQTKEACCKQTYLLGAQHDYVGLNSHMSWPSCWVCCYNIIFISERLRGWGEARLDSVKAESP